MPFSIMRRKYIYFNKKKMSSRIFLFSLETTTNNNISLDQEICQSKTYIQKCKQATFYVDVAAFHFLSRLYIKTKSFS